MVEGPQLFFFGFWCFLDQGGGTFPPFATGSAQRREAEQAAPWSHCQWWSAPSHVSQFQGQVQVKVGNALNAVVFSTLPFIVTGHHSIGAAVN